MINLLKYKYKYCRKYSEDLWGFVLSKGKYDKLSKHLATEQRWRRRQRWRSKVYKELLGDRKKVCLYYGGLKIKAYKRYSLAQLECRLAMVVYRLNFVSSIAEGINLVKSGYFLVNKEVIVDANYLVKVGEVIEVVSNHRSKLYQRLEERLKNRFYPMAYPQYFEVNYQLMAGVLLHEPLFEEIYFPFALEKIAIGEHYL